MSEDALTALVISLFCLPVILPFVVSPIKDKISEKRHAQWKAEKEQQKREAEQRKRAEEAARQKRIADWRARVIDHAQRTNYDFDKALSKAQIKECPYFASGTNTTDGWTIHAGCGWKDSFKYDADRQSCECLEYHGIAFNHALPTYCGEFYKHVANRDPDCDEKFVRGSCPYLQSRNKYVEYESSSSSYHGEGYETFCSVSGKCISEYAKGGILLRKLDTDHEETDFCHNVYYYGRCDYFQSTKREPPVK